MIACQWSGKKSQAVRRKWYFSRRACTTRGQTLEFRALKLSSAWQEPTSDEEQSVGHNQSAQARHDAALYARMPTKGRRVAQHPQRSAESQNQRLCATCSALLCARRCLCTPLCFTACGCIQSGTLSFGYKSRLRVSRKKHDEHVSTLRDARPGKAVLRVWQGGKSPGRQRISLREETNSLKLCQKSRIVDWSWSVHASWRRRSKHFSELHLASRRSNRTRRLIPYLMLSGRSQVSLRKSNLLLPSTS